MIGRLKGQLVARQPPWVLVDVNGVGYEVEVPMSTFYDLPATGDVILLIHTVVREDALLLYGFLREAERSLFRRLLKVNGVGAKLALAILSGMSTQEFADAVRRNDVSTLVRLPGIGRKTAERLIVEMRDRLGEDQKDETLPGVSAVVRGAFEEAITALEALGYKPAEAACMVRAVPDAARLEAKEIIRAALRQAVK